MASGPARRARPETVKPERPGCFPGVGDMRWDGESSRSAGATRRSLIGSGALLTAGCAGWPDLPPGPDGSGRAGVVDSHVHLFNAADLPVHRFIEYTFARKFAAFPGGSAVIDVFTTVVKPLSPTIDAELRALRGRRGVRETSPQRFADAATARSLGLSVAEIENGERPSLQKWDADTGVELAASYDALIAVLAAAHLPEAEIEPLFQSLTRDASSLRLQADLRRRVFEATAAGADEGPAEVERRARAAFGILQAKRMNLLAPEEALTLDIVGEVVRTVRWGFVMLQPRTSHLQRYLRSYRAPDAQPATVLNLLIDFDSWLLDGPSPGCSQTAQIEFWETVADHYEGDVEIKTFAAYCPLKHAQDVRENGVGSTYLKGLEDAFAAGKIAGLKLYPPMGFFPIGNAGRPNRAHVGDDGIGSRVVDEWVRTAGSAPLGDALDRCLTAAYEMCQRVGLPILAHAGPSNTPASNFVTRPDPANWIPVAQAYPRLHLMMGHFVDDARSFVTAMEAGNNASDAWAIKSTARLLRAHPNVFVDLSYTEEILGSGNADLAVRFFRSLHRYAAENDAFDQIAYGSDWIMLQREGDHRRYLEIMRASMRLASWTPSEIERVFVGNGRRFLSPRPGLAS